MKTIMTTLGLIALLGTLTSCCNNTGAALEGSHWNLIELEGESITPQGNFYLMLGGERPGYISARGDCNQIMGRYTLEGKKEIDFDALASTRAMCAQQMLEDRYMAMLDDVDTYVIEGELLTFYDDKTPIAIFQLGTMTPAAAPAPQPDSSATPVAPLPGDSVAAPTK